MKYALLLRGIAAALFLSAISAGAQTQKIDGGKLDGLEKKPGPAMVSKSISKSAKLDVPQLKPGEMQFNMTKGARIVSQADGTLIESPLVEIPVLFDTGKATLRTDAVSQTNLQLLADKLLAIKDADARFVINGFASAEGDGEANLKLSQDRAATVRAALIERGVSANVLTAEGLGTRFTTAKATDPEELRARDRKVLAVRDK